MTADSLPLLKKKVAVLGTATSTLDQAPVLDDSWEVWACSSGMQGKLNPRGDDGAHGFDRFFEIHWREQFCPQEKANFLPWLGQCGKPVYTFDELGLANQVLYPRAAIEAQHGSAFLTSTIAWMLALAIDHRPDAIGIWGVDMADDTEYAHQKAGCLHFIALARLFGINIHIPAASELHRVPAPYPDRYAGETARVLRSHLDQAETDLKDVEAELARLRLARRSIEAAEAKLETERAQILAVTETLKTLSRKLV